MAYELLTYRQAFPGSAHVAVLHSVLHDTPPAIETLDAGIDPEIVRIVTRAMEKLGRRPLSGPGVHGVGTRARALARSATRRRTSRR